MWIASDVSDQERVQLNKTERKGKKKDTKQFIKVPSTNWK